MKWLVAKSIDNPIVTEVFIRGRKLQISLVFITQLNFDKRKLQQIAIIQSFNIEFKDFMKIIENVETFFFS